MLKRLAMIRPGILHGGKLMLKRLAILIGILFWCSCSENQPEKITSVEDHAFGEILENKDSDIREIPVKFLTDRDTLEIRTSVGTHRIWQISIIVPEVPGSGDPQELLRDAVAKKYSLKFGSTMKLSLPGTEIEISRAFDRGERGARCTFTDPELQNSAVKETAEAGNARKLLIRQAEKDILNLEYTVNAFHDETGVYPASWEWLINDPKVKNWQGPYIKKVPLDPWGREYCYERTAKGYVIYSAGADGKSRIIP